MIGTADDVLLLGAAIFSIHVLITRNNKRLEIFLYAPHQSITPSMLDAFLSTIPSLIPTGALDHKVHELRELVKVAEPAQWLYDQAQAWETAMLCNTTEQSAVMAGLLYMTPRQGPPDTIEAAKLDVEMPARAEFIEPIVPLMRALGSISNAFWGNASSEDAMGYIVRNFQGHCRPTPRPGREHWQMHRQ